MESVQESATIVKYCEACGMILDPRKYSPKAYATRKYCTSLCRSRTLAALEQRRNRRTGIKSVFVELAGGMCLRCGYQEFLSGLQFHHVDPSLKDDNPGELIYRNDYANIYTELDKCALLCSNCHHAFHAGEWCAEFIKRQGLGWAI